MMNLLQVQDDLKNFSQDQLVKEMQQPSGSTPQFLVLSELNRRKIGAFFVAPLAEVFVKDKFQEISEAIDRVTKF